MALVLLIACGNLAMLCFARNAAREHDVALRTALGASRTQLVQQFLVESGLISLFGGALGLLFAIWATPAFTAWAKLNTIVRIDANVLWFTAAVSVITSVLIGFFPAFRMSRIVRAQAIRHSFGASSRLFFRTAKAILVFQIAASLTLLAGAGLFLRTLKNLEHVDLGLNPNHLLVFGIDPAPLNLAGNNLVRFYDGLIRQLRTLPDITSVTMTQNRIGAGWGSNSYFSVDGTTLVNAPDHTMRWNIVGPEFVRTFGMQLIMGRDFSDADSVSASGVAIVNQSFAEKHLPGMVPLGHQIRFVRSRLSGLGPFTIVGVVRNAKYGDVRENPTPTAYFPFTQMGELREMHFALRTRGDPGGVLASARQVVSDYAPGVPLLNVMTQQAQIEETFSAEKIFARLSRLFGALSILLVAVGVYGSLSYMTERRRAEIGTRIALGAQRGNVIWLVVKESLTICLIGCALGLPLAYIAARLVRSMLYGVNPGNLGAFVSAALGIVAVGCVATLAPAWRAAHSDPMQVLRAE